MSGPSTCDTSSFRSSESGCSRRSRPTPNLEGYPTPKSTAPLPAQFMKEHISTTAAFSIPGYAGYKPGVYAKNIYAKSVTKASCEASTLHKTRRDGVAASTPPVSPQSTGSRPKSSKPKFPVGAEIPGYSGYVPGIGSGNLVASCTPRAAKCRWDPDRDGPRPRLEKLDKVK